jgi:hypothetical protein
MPVEPNRGSAEIDEQAANEHRLISSLIASIHLN